MPSGKIDKPVIEDNRDGTVSLKYEPREEGLHELLVKYNGEHVQGIALVFFQYSILADLNSIFNMTNFWGRLMINYKRQSSVI